MTWPSPIVCQSLDLEKETFRCDSCFPYKVHFLYIKDIWFAWPKYVQINLSLTSSLARPAQLSVVFEVNTIHQSNFQSTSLVSKKRKDTWIYEVTNTKPLKNRLKTRSYTCRSLWTAGRRDSTVFGVVNDTTTTKVVNRACAVHGISLPVVVVVLKFPIISRKTSSC